MKGIKEKGEGTAESMDQGTIHEVTAGKSWVESGPEEYIHLTNSQLALLENELRKATGPCLMIYEPDVHLHVATADMLKRILPRVEYLPDDVSYKMGKADGMEQLKPLYDDLKKTERELAAARRKGKLAQGKVKELERKLAEKAAVISMIKSAREFYAQCRDFAKDYCKTKKDNATEAARKLMEQDWFIKGIKLHDSRWLPKGSSGSAIGHTNEAIADNLAKEIRRWRTANWKLPFED